MGSYTTLKNRSLDIQLDLDYQDNGWSFQGGMAIHDSINEGAIINKVFRPSVGKEYVLEIQISGLTDGFLEVYMGGVLFGVITESGLFSFNAVVVNSDPLRFNSGFNNVTIVSYKIMEGFNDGNTIIFDTLNNMYIGETSIKGEYIDKFLEDTIVYKNGVPWISDKNSIRNSFFGVNYPSVIKFYCNISYDIDKDFYNITLNGNSAWGVDLSLPPRPGKRLGQKSRIKKGNFNFHKGKYIADILRDMNDPRFSKKVQALMKGAYLQGKVMEVTITNDSKDLVELMSVDIDVSLK